VTAPDSSTVVVRYRSPYAPALASWGTAILPAHLLEGQDITRSPLARKPIGTGPFRFKEWVAGQKIVLEANPDYFEGRPYLDRYVYRVIPDTSTMYMELKAGGVDMMGLTPVQYARQTGTRQFKGQFNKYRYPSNGYLYLGYNLRHPLFKDVRVRRAITAAINKDELIQGVLFGMGQKAAGPICARDAGPIIPRCRIFPLTRPMPNGCWPRPAGNRGRAACCTKTASRCVLRFSPTRVTSNV